MERYRRTIIIRAVLLALAVLLAAGIGTYDVFGVTDELKSSDIFGFQCGLTIGIGALALARLIRYGRVLRGEKALQIEYNRENDERMRAIKAKAGLPVILMTSVAMIAAGVIAGYSSETAFCALIGAAVCQLLVACALKLYYMRTM